MNYRNLAFSHYWHGCAFCGFGIEAVLEVTHLDGNRANDDVANLAILCPTCNKMHGIDLISSSVIREMRDRPREIIWAKRNKDAGAKAALTKKRRAAAHKAVATRRKNDLNRPPV